MSKATFQLAAMEAARARLAAGGASGAAPDGARPCKEHSSLAGGGLEGCEAERPRAEPGLPPSIAQRMLIVSRMCAQVCRTRRQEKVAWQWLMAACDGRRG